MKISNLKNLGKNALLLGGLVGILSASPKYSKASASSFYPAYMHATGILDSPSSGLSGPGMLLVDLNNDGKTDILRYKITKINTGILEPFKFHYDISVALNKYSSFDRFQNVIESSEPISELFVGDLDGDKKRDLFYLIERRSSSGVYDGKSLYVAKGNGDGTFKSPVEIKRFSKEEL